MTIVLWAIGITLATVIAQLLAVAFLPAHLPTQALDFIEGAAETARALDSVLPVHEALEVLTAEFVLLGVAMTVLIIRKLVGKLRT